MPKAPTFTATARGYTNLWNRMVVRPERRAQAKAIAERLLSNRDRYEAIAREVSCPYWWLPAIIHELECGGNFSRHLHNGDPLSRRTVRVPAGRPVSGTPPFTFHVSAIDALRSHDMHLIRDWSIARALHFLEGYNGWGYWGKICTPYLWSFSTHYFRGKFTKDHFFDPNAISQQCGAAVILRSILDLTDEHPAKGDEMQELKDYLHAYQAIAPGIINALGTRLDDLLLDLFAEALGDSTSSGADNILASLKQRDASKRLDILGKVEASIRPFLPVEIQPVAEAKPTMASAETPSAPVVTPLDRILGPGVGYRTVAGIVVLFALKIVVAAGVAPWLPMGLIEPLIEGYIGVAAVAKVNRFLALLGK